MTAQSVLSTTGNHELDLDRARITELYRQGRISMPGLLFLAIVAVITLWDNDSQIYLLVWLAAFLVLLVIRTLIGEVFLGKLDRISNCRRWGTVSACFSALIGVSWGCLAILELEPVVGTPLVVITILIMGITAGAPLALSSYLPSYFAISIPSLGTLTAIMFYYSSSIGLTFGWFCLTAFITFTYYFINTHKKQIATLRVGFDNIRLRQQSEHQQQLLEDTFENINHGIALVNSNNVVQVSNSLFKTLTSTLQRGENHQPIVSPYGFAQSDAQHEEITTPAGVVLEVHRKQLKDGGSVITVADISDRKRRERNLQDARDQAESANSAKTRFLAAASHDLRQPIHALGLLFSTLAEEVVTTSNRKTISLIERSIHSVDTMLNSLLDMSKLDAGVVTAQMNDIDVGTIVNGLANEFSSIAHNAGIKLSVDVDSLHVVSDATLLERIIRNLISNAINVAPGGIIRLRGALVDNEVRLSIDDSGPGIPPDQREFVFEEFVQLDQLNPRGHGLGLGLSIVKRLARLLSHDVSIVDSDLGGASFVLKMRASATNFHCDDVRPCSTDSSAHHPRSTFEGRRIMVVDDDATILSAMQSLLLNWGCEVCTRQTLGDAKEALNNDFSPDLLLMDYRLDGQVNGVDAITELRTLHGRFIPAILITAETAPENLRDATTSGNAILHKPVRPSDLKISMSDALKSREKNLGNVKPE